MKILYAIQGTGNGHLARATDIVPQLQKLAETDVLISGIQGDIQLPFKVKYRFYGISFIFGTRGGVNIWKTLTKMRLLRFLKDIRKLPVKDYDVVFCDFEPVSSWACRLKGKRSIGLSHQNAVLHPAAPKPKKNDWFGKFILKHYAPVSEEYGFHFESFEKNIFTPVIRPAIRNATPFNKGHYTVYLPAYSNHEIEKVLLKFPEERWEVFSKHSKETYQSGNIHFQPVSLENFTKSFITCRGILCNAGFETPSEAIYMGKKLCVIPMKNQYEQQCNATYLAKMGILVLSQLDQVGMIQLNYWLGSTSKLRIKYSDHTHEIISMLILKEKFLKSREDQKAKVSFHIPQQPLLHSGTELVES